MSMLEEAKVAVFPKGFMEELSDGRMSVFDWIEQASTLGADGLEMYPLFLPNTKEPDLLRIKSAAYEHGLLIPMMCSSPDFTHPDPQFRRDQIFKMKQMIDVMHILGPQSFRSCRVLSGQRRDNVSRADGIRWTVQCIQELLPYAEQKRVHLVMENHYKDGFWSAPEFAQYSEVFYEIIDQIHSPWFGINYDPSNAIVADEDPLDILREVKDRIITMHASDRYLKKGHDVSALQDYRAEGYSSALLHGVIGEGLNDYTTIFKELQSVTFRGWISIEDGVNGLDEMRRSVSFVRQQIQHYL